MTAAGIPSSTVAAGLADITQRLEAAASASGRPLPRLVAVSKTKPTEMLREAYDAGMSCLF